MSTLYSIEQLRKAQLYIADEVKRVCEENDIKYHLDFGSLLGAIRHKGFIPWDDDMDMGMLREEYDRFIAIAPKVLKPDFFLDNYQINPSCPLVFSKVKLKGTRYIEAKGNEKLEHNEIFVDIFPFYDIADNPMESRKEGMVMGFVVQILLSKARYHIWAGEGLKKRIKFLPIEISSHFYSVKRLRRIEDRLYRKHHDMRFVCVHGGSLREYRNLRIPKEILQQHDKASFEGHEYSIPKMYDQYLKILYGDYMVLPPEDQRLTHMIKELDLGKYSF